MKAKFNSKNTQPSIQSEIKTDCRNLSIEDLDNEIMEELGDEIQAAVSGGWKIISADPNKSITAEDYNKLAGFWGG